MPYLLMFVSLAAGILALLPRVDGEYLAGRYLWAEDGNIFIQQARHLGINAVFQTYAGYLHLYPRLIAFFASFFGLKTQANILFLGWFLAFWLMAYVILSRAVDLGVSLIEGCALIALVALQPSYGEVFFNITNAQSMLGVALSVLVLSRKPEKRTSFQEGAWLFVLCLTGPFAIFIALVLIPHVFLSREVKWDRTFLSILILCALVQAACLVLSERVGAAGAERSIAVWVRSFGLLAAFGARSTVHYASVIFFWMVFVFALFFPTKDLSEKTRSRRTVAGLCLLVAIVNIFAALYSAKSYPMAIVPLGGGNRYTWVPYSLILFSALLASASLVKARYFLLVAVGTICYCGFHPVRLLNLQFDSYANFSRYSEVVIPINPLWPVFPGWHITWGERVPLPLPIRSERVAYDDLLGYQVALDRSAEGVHFVADGDDPIFVLRNEIVCPDAKDIGVEVTLSRSSAGWVQVFWSASAAFSESKSIRRYYPAGEIQAQFAFPNSPEGVHLRFDPLDRQGEGRVSRFIVYCLP
ncbi:MAG TPA: hypothetical protein VJ572_05210 [Azonexus sp.]|nr:hypothetical protein [Azonexus sp.]